VFVCVFPDFRFEKPLQKVFGNFKKGKIRVAWWNNFVLNQHKMHISTFLSSAVDFVKEWIDSWYHQDFANDENNEMQQLLNAFIALVMHQLLGKVFFVIVDNNIVDRLVSLLLRLISLRAM
jgi:hypothetical protein